MRKKDIGWYTAEPKEKRCPLCDRPMPEGSWNRHHLLPVMFGGKETIKLHKICHNAIHRTFTERDLFKFFHTIDRIKGHESIFTFVSWVKKKPNDFYASTKESNNKRNHHK